MTAQYSPLEKVAILMLSLGEDLAGELLTQLPREQAQKIVQTLVRLQNVDHQTAKQIQAEFSSLLTQSSNQKLPNGSSFASRVIQSAFDQDVAAQVMAQLPKETAQCFRDAELIDSKQLFRLLSLEHPQTIALILAHLSAKKSGEVVSFMHPQTRGDILLRLATIQEADQKALHELEQTLSKIIAECRKSNSKQLGGPSKTAQILAFMNPEQRKQLLTEIETKSAALAEEVRAGLFTFEDIAKLDRLDVEKLLAKITPQDLELALRKCPESLAALFFSAMSERRAEQLKENIASTKPVQIAKVTEAQRKIAATASELIATGQLRDPLEEAV